MSEKKLTGQFLQGNPPKLSKPSPLPQVSIRYGGRVAPHKGQA